ncbi:hypothetical protein SLE2022_012710 [Rubroshorea leprosula]
MGLSSKEVSGDGGLGCSQALLKDQTLEQPKPPVKRQQQNQSEQLKCPRCDSTNTKFCYYNNYNKSQPRHFCKACKRHWTKGGTLRNVPVGGGRKNKRLKTLNSGGGGAATSGASTSTAAGISNMGSSQFQEQRQGKHDDHLPFLLDDLKNVSDFNNSVLSCPPPSLDSGHGVFLGSTSTLPLSQNQALHFPFSRSSSTSFDTNPSSISTSFQSPNVYETMEDTTITSITRPSTRGEITLPLWQKPCASSAFMDMTNYWNWDDIDALVSTDLNIPWDDSETKP